MINEQLSTTKKIQKAILSLPDSEKASILQWLIQMDRKLWDKEIEADFSEGGPGAKLTEKLKMTTSPASALHGINIGHPPGLLEMLSETPG